MEKIVGGMPPGAELDRAKAFLAALCAPLGGRATEIFADYRDGNYQYFHRPFTTVFPGEPSAGDLREFAEWVLACLARQGYAAVCLTEILGDGTPRPLWGNPDELAEALRRP